MIDALANAARVGIGRRFAALAYDAVLVAALLLLITLAIVMLVTRSAITEDQVGVWAYLYRAMLALLILGYYILCCVRSGQTLGMRAWRVRVLSTNGRRLTARQAAVRFFAGLLAWLPAALGVLWLYVDRQGLALQDRLSRSRVVRLTRP